MVLRAFSLIQWEYGKFRKSFKRVRENLINFVKKVFEISAMYNGVVATQEHHSVLKREFSIYIFKTDMIYQHLTKDVRECRIVLLRVNFGPTKWIAHFSLYFLFGIMMRQTYRANERARWVFDVSVAPLHHKANHIGKRNKLLVYIILVIH